MLERKILSSIKDWYESSTNALLLDGARQVGKTTAIREFLKEEDIDFVEINLAEDSLAREAFNTSTNAEQLLLRLSSYQKAAKEDCLYFIDEIQEAKDGITPIKFLSEKSSHRFIFSGSLLGVKMSSILSVPVGFLSRLRMYPMDFEEFCLANGVNKAVLNLLSDCFANKSSVDDIIHRQMMSLFRAYLAVGGMPKAVSEFVTQRSLRAVNDVLSTIDFIYKEDIAKYDQTNKLQIQEIYDLIPNELNANNKRFVLKSLNQKARFYQYETSFAYLKHSGVGLFVHNVDNVVVPLLASKERTLFKLFYCDVGLLSYRYYQGKQLTLLNADSTENKGAIYEAFVAIELTAHGYDLYYNTDKKRGEIDFLIEKGNHIVPIEVKSGKDYKRHSALSSLLESQAFDIEEAYVFHNGNIKVEGKTVYLPIYMTMFLREKEVGEEAATTINLDISSLI